MTEKVDCPVCGQQVALTAAGKIRAHKASVTIFQRVTYACSGAGRQGEVRA